jgi:hypothetical protein
MTDILQMLLRLFCLLPPELKLVCSSAIFYSLMIAVAMFKIAYQQGA